MEKCGCGAVFSFFSFILLANILKNQIGLKAEYGRRSDETSSPIQGYHGLILEVSEWAYCSEVSLDGEGEDIEMG